jgi:hypothetical protein
MTEIVIKEVLRRKELKDFVSFPFSLYAGNKFWIPPLRSYEMRILSPATNPVFDFCRARYWLAYKNGRPAGRIAAILNSRYIERWKRKELRFGWIDFIDDLSVTRALLETVEAWARDLKMEAVHGPMGFTDLDPEGMLIEGFDKLGTMQTIYNYPYYPDHLEKLGYAKEVDWVEYEVTVPYPVHEKLQRMAHIVAQRNNLTIAPIKKSRDLLPYVKEIFEVLNQAYENLYGVVALTERQIQHYVTEYLGFVHPDFVCVVLDQTGHVAAFAITMPSLSRALQKAAGRLYPFGFFHLLKARSTNDTADLCVISVRPDLQGKGLNALIMHQLNLAYVKHHILKAETNPELETNSQVQAQWKFFQTTLHKRRRCYIKNL